MAGYVILSTPDPQRTPEAIYYLIISKIALWLKEYGIYT